MSRQISVSKLCEEAACAGPGWQGSTVLACSIGRKPLSFGSHLRRLWAHVQFNDRTFPQLCNRHAQFVSEPAVHLGLLDIVILWTVVLGAYHDGFA